MARKRLARKKSRDLYPRKAVQSPLPCPTLRRMLHFRPDFRSKTEGDPMTSAKGPGDRIEARCTRCNDITGHVIVAQVSGQIVKVECCACGSVHKYYPPKAEQALADSGVRRVRQGGDRKEAMSASRASTPRAPRASSRALAEAAALEKSWREQLERPSSPAPRAYAMSMSLQKGDVVEHSVFGLGTVQAVARPDKAEILFREGIKVLRCVC